MVFKDITHSSFNNITASDHVEFNHEKVFYYEDQSVGLISIVAIHDTSSGPAIGGCRFKSYNSYEDGLSDVLRLSRGMTHKNVVANIPFGGGKAIIFADGPKTHELLQSFGNFLNLIDGEYISAEDIGITLEDIQFINKFSDHVFDNVDPGPYTARGIFYSIQAIIQYVHGSDLTNKNISIQGAGSVGSRLAKHLADEGSTVFIHDFDEQKTKSLVSDSIHLVANPLSQPCEIFAPCAVGGILSEQSISHLGAKIIAGGANNQLLHPHIDSLLFQAGITYIPDVLINSGGVIGLTKDLLKRDDAQINLDLEAIASRVINLMDESKQSSKSILDIMNRSMF